LGYDVFDATEVIPEYTADVGIKKGEKVDYAIVVNGKVSILIEAKMLGTKLDVQYSSQLHRYFHATEARIGVLTDGVIYKFYTDLDANNKMDARPFLEFSLQHLDENIVAEIKKFSKNGFNIDDLLLSANEMKYTKEIKTFISEQITTPGEDFVNVVLKNVYSGIKTAQVKEQFRPLVKKAFMLLLNETLNERLKSAMNIESRQDVTAYESKPVSDIEDAVSESFKKDKIDTTQEELEGYYAVKSMLSGLIDLQRIVYRDTLSYFGILLDDNNRKPICRLHFNGGKKYLEVFDREKKGEKILVNGVDDLYQHREKIIAAIDPYMSVD
jgi:predicted type IV restriction endonuclease